MRNTMSITQAALVSLCLCAAVFIAGSAVAQTNLETNAGIQFNFSTPGAANLALGGAFIALADDATAAYTNPAGLVGVYDREVHLEARSWRYTHVFTDHGRAVGEPTGQGLDTIPGIKDGEAEDGAAGLSFLSYVHPKKRWTFAIYRHDLVSFEANFSTQGAFLEPTRGRSPTGIPGERDGRLASLANRMNLDIATYGFAVAWRAAERLSLGLSLVYFDFHLDSRTDRFVPRLFERSDFRDASVVNFQTQRGEDSKLGVNFGVLWESPQQVWSLGAVYRQGPAFDFRAASRQGPASTVLFIEAMQDAELHVPDVYGLGAALRPTDAIRVALDVNRVEYGDLLDGFVDIFDLETLFPGADAELDRFAVNDVTEVHLGLELFFYLRKFPFSLRFGAWHEPDHSLRFDGENIGFQAVFRERDDQTHLSFGFGIARDRFQVDAAFDFSERVSTLALSAVFRF